MTEGLVKCPNCYRQFWIREAQGQSALRAVPPHSYGGARCPGSNQTVPVVDRRQR
jgi:hypothetical protein